MKQYEDKAVRGDQVERRGATEVVTQLAEVGATGLVTGAAVEAGRRLVGQALERPPKESQPELQVEHGYRPKE